MEAWNIKQLKQALEASIAACQSQHEISMCKAIAGKEIRERAQEWAMTRKLTPVEVAIARDFGYKGN